MFNIFEEISWPYFVQLNGINKMPLNEQVNAYNQYLFELNTARQNWIDTQNKGPLLTSEPVSPYTLIINITVGSDGDFYRFGTVTFGGNSTDATIDWGDGTDIFETTLSGDQNTSHTYDTAGTYTVYITLSNPEVITRFYSDQND